MSRSPASVCEVPDPHPRERLGGMVERHALGLAGHADAGMEFLERPGKPIEVVASLHRHHVDIGRQMRGAVQDRGETPDQDISNAVSIEHVEDVPRIELSHRSPPPRGALRLAAAPLRAPDPAVRRGSAALPARPWTTHPRRAERHGSRGRTRTRARGRAAVPTTGLRDPLDPCDQRLRDGRPVGNLLLGQAGPTPALPEELPAIHGPGLALTCIENIRCQASCQCATLISHSKSAP